MKFNKIFATMVMCATIGGMSYAPMSVRAAEAQEHFFEYTREVDTGYTESGYENCIHCAMCVNCTDYVTYGYFIAYAYCPECDKEFPAHDYMKEISRACDCSNPSCCY